jgi:farnesyl-diphosphate farnesyltransferase
MALGLIFLSQIEQWVERHYPSFVAITGGSDGVQAGINESDVRARIVKRDREVDLKLENERRGAGEGTPRGTPQYKEDDSWPWELFAVVGGAMTVMVGMGAFITWLIITYFSD